MMRIPFTKMAAAGNDFLLIDTRRAKLARPRAQWRSISRTLCDRRYGVGADGLLVLGRSSAAHVSMRVFNPDGSEAEMCGNGARCVALYVKERGKWKVESGKTVTIETKAGVLSARVRGSRVAMRMTDPTDLRLGMTLDVDQRRLRMGFVNTGVPHAVIPVKAVETIDVDRLGRTVRHLPRFSPRGTNVDFIQPDARRPNRLHVRTYERGVEGETLACGTGVAASAVVHVLMRGNNGRARQQRIEVETRSGEVLTVSLTVVPQSRGWRITNVVMEGGALRIFDGTAVWPIRRM